MNKKKNNCSSSVCKPEDDCCEKISGLGVRYIIIIAEKYKSEDITPDLIETISKKYNVPANNIKVFKSGEIGLKYQVHKKEIGDKREKIPLTFRIEDKRGEELIKKHKLFDLETACQKTVEAISEGYAFSDLKDDK